MNVCVNVCMHVCTTDLWKDSINLLKKGRNIATSVQTVTGLSYCKTSLPYLVKEAIV
jgi:hypothetical protein